MFKPRKMAIAAFAVVAGCGAALAQTPQRVEVTGSNIKRIDLETASPVQIITRDEIRQSGSASVRELVERLTASSVGSLSDINGSNSFASGASSADLRNLGKASTLVLFNSRRVSPFALADFNELFTNLDALPLSAVDRIEILRSGASAIYGSDAVAGVINIITRKDYSGVEVSAAHQQSQVSHRFKQDVASITAGKGSLDRDGFNILANLEVFKRESVMWRDVMAHVNPLRLSSGAVPATFNAQLSTYSYPGNLIGPSGPVTGTTAVCPANLVVDGLCRYDRFARFQALPEAERANGLLSGRMRLGGGAELYSELLLSRTMTTYQSAYMTYGYDDVSGPSPFTVWGDPTTNGSQLFYGRGLPAGHPLNPTDAEVGLRYRFTDAPSQSSVTATSYRWLTGLAGSLGSMDYDLALGFLGAKATDRQQGRFSKSGFADLVGDFTPDTLAADFFNKPGGYRIGEVNTTAVVNRLFPVFGTDAKTTQTVLDGKLTGELAAFTLPGGVVRWAAGADLRLEKFTILPSANLAVGDIVGLGLSRTDGSRNFWSTYGEFDLPITKTLDAQLAARLDKYPKLRANISPKLGLTWRANDMLLLRGTVETGFRAPNLTETAPSVKFAFNNDTLDPKRCSQAVALATDLRTRADAEGTSPADATLLDARADKVEGDECLAGVAAIVANNPALKPEKSRSFSLGLALQPTRDLSMTADYWNIQRKAEIDIKTAEEMLAIEGRTLSPGALILRRPLDGNDQTFSLAEQAQYGVTAGALSAIQRSFENLFRTKTSGIDLGFEVREKLPFGDLKVTGLGTYLISYKEFVGADNRFGDNLAGRYGRPRVKATLDFALTTGAWRHVVTVRHSSGYALAGDYYDPEGNAAWCASNTYARPCAVNALTTVDYGVSWSGSKGLTLSLYMQNLGNKFEPIDFRDQQRGSVVPAEPDDAKRRTWRLKADYAF
ncbi:MAG: TonB-dependent receptor [Aquabacterium sp.]|nr:TonB-dependent receptor [Aquabacterium sp.]